MASFIYGTKLNLELEKMIKNADKFLWFISPYIKLHDRIKQELKGKLDNHKLEICIVFGKNENDVSKSLSMDDVQFLKQFPNISISYEKSLHAKFYASEDCCLITSMNLHQYSQNTNIEIGVVLEPHSHLKKLANLVTESVDPGDEALDYFEAVIKNSEKLFVKKPQFEGGLFSSKYKDSIIEIDKLDGFFGQPRSDYKNPRPNSFSQVNTAPAPVEKKITLANTATQSAGFKPGFCIRTGKPIAFNPKRPMTDEAFQSWMKFKNENYPEKYCHFSGEPSNGETTVSKPILRKNWNKAKEWKA